MQKQNGFSAVIVVVLLVLGLAALVIWRVIDQNQPASKVQNQEQNSPSSGASTANGQLVVSDDNKVQFTLPEAWELIDRAAPTSRGCQSGYSSPRTITDSTKACLLLVTIGPRDFQGESVWSARVYKTTLSPREWAEYPLGIPNADFKAQTTGTINGYESFSVKVDSASYTDLNYFIKKDDHIIYFSARERVKGGDAGPAKDLSGYTPEFLQIINSVEFK